MGLNQLRRLLLGDGGSHPHKLAPSEPLRVSAHLLGSIYLLELPSAFCGLVALLAVAPAPFLASLCSPPLSRSST